MILPITLFLTQHRTQTNIRSNQHRAGILVYTSKTGSGTVTQRSITGKLLSDATNAPINVKPHHPPPPPPPPPPIGVRVGIGYPRSSKSPLPGPKLQEIPLFTNSIGVLPFTIYKSCIKTYLLCTVYSTVESLRKRSMHQGPIIVKVYLLAMLKFM